VRSVRSVPPTVAQRPVPAGKRNAQGARSHAVDGDQDARKIGEDRGSPTKSFTISNAVVVAAGCARRSHYVVTGGRGGSRGETGKLWVSVESRWTTLERVDDVLLMLACRRCHTPFFVCRKDYRGQAYCGAPCRAAARVASARAARALHERSDAGRLDHRDRQRAYRIRLRARVTDHASPAMSLPRSMSPPRSEPAPPAPRAPLRQGIPTCARCGCQSAWVRWAAQPGTRIRSRRRARQGRSATVQCHRRIHQAVVKRADLGVDPAAVRREPMRHATHRARAPT